MFSAFEDIVMIGYNAEGKLPHRMNSASGKQNRLKPVRATMPNMF
jgi:hypothetical protein